MARNFRIGGLAALVSLALPLTLPAAVLPPAPLFAEHGVLQLTLEAPFKKLMDERSDEDNVAGNLIYVDADGSSKPLAVKLRTRGHYRRDRVHCDFAPIRLNFRKTEVAGTLFDGQDKLKLVTRCMPADAGYTKVVPREYLAYRLFQELTEISYGVRLLEITYVDTQTGTRMTRFAFVIEGEKAVARRNALKRVRVKRTSEDEHEPARRNLVDLFEFMIGNTEYSLVNPEPDKSCCHNSDILSSTGGPPYIALPFDFDFAGLVNAPYAEPNPRYPIPSVRNRFYKGLCVDNALLSATIGLFERRRDAVFRVIDEVAGTSSTAHRAMRWSKNYVGRFYGLIGDPNRVQRDLIDRCDASASGQ